MRRLLYAYPRRWRERYGDELLAVLEADPLTWRVAANVIGAGLRERLRHSGSPLPRILWGWSLFVVGGMAFQKTSEHWQTFVPAAHRGVPTVAFDTVQAAAVVGSACVIAGVVLALPGFLRDLRGVGWSVMRRPLVLASSLTVVWAFALVALALDQTVVAAYVFVAASSASLLAWTHAAAAAARRLPLRRVHSYLALVLVACMLVMTAAAAVWFASVDARAASFVGGAQLAVVATFMALGVAVGAAGVRALPPHVAVGR